MTPLPDLVHGTARHGPGLPPVYLGLLPPSNAGSPAGENTKAWLADNQAGRAERFLGDQALKQGWVFDRPDRGARGADHLRPTGQ